MDFVTDALASATARADSDRGGCVHAGVSGVRNRYFDGQSARDFACWIASSPSGARRNAFAVTTARSSPAEHIWPGAWNGTSTWSTSGRASPSRTRYIESFNGRLARRMPERELVPQSVRRQAPDRRLARTLQLGPAAFGAWIIERRNEFALA